MNSLLSKTIAIRVEQHNDIDYVALHISDTGHCIPEEKLARIFEPICTGNRTTVTA